MVHDDVDEIQLAWARERPGTPVASIGVITRIWRIAKVLDDDRRSTMDRLRMDVPTRNLLSTLRRSGEPYMLSASEIARRSGVSPGAVSQWVARCESTGLVRRSRDADDRRSVQVMLTAKGRRTIERVVGDLLRHEDELVAGLTGDEVTRLGDLLRKLLAGLESRRR